MMRQSPSRGQRGRGWNVKHALQICVLVAVCVWLAYQVKHSQDKKKALEESNLKVSDRVEEGGANILKLGRKDPHGNVVIIDTDNSTQGEEEEGREAEEAAEHGKKQEEIEEERKGRTEGHETEENGEEKADGEAQHGEESDDEEESTAEPEGDAGASENQDHEGADGDSQEAREEHYKADDASSAVVRDTQEIAQENEVLHTEENSEEQEEKAQVEEIGNGGGTNVTEDGSKDTEEVHDNPVDGESKQHHHTSPVEAATVERESGAESLSNSTLAAGSDGHIEAYKDTTPSSDEQMEQQNNSAVSEPNDRVEQQNSSVDAAGDEQVGAQGVSGGVDAGTVESTTPENATVLDMASADEDQSKVQETRTLEEDSSNSENNAVEHNEQIDRQSNSTETVSDEQTQNISEGVITAETVESTPGNATADASSVQDQNTVTEATPVTEDNSNTENAPAEKTEKSNPTRAEGVDESQQQQTSQGDGASSSDLPSVTTEQEQDSRTDLSTLPEAAETKSAEGIAAE